MSCGFQSPCTKWETGGLVPLPCTAPLLESLASTPTSQQPDTGQWSLILPHSSYLHLSNPWALSIPSLEYLPNLLMLPFPISALWTELQPLLPRTSPSFLPQGLHTGSPLLLECSTSILELPASSFSSGLHLYPTSSRKPLGSLGQVRSRCFPCILYFSFTVSIAIILN